jgi:hypothetical protein
MRGITFISGPLSEEGKLRLAEFSRKREERLAKLAEDCKNSIIEKSYDGFIKVTIPNLGVVTWAKDVEDAKVAIAEAVMCVEHNLKNYGK